MFVAYNTGSSRIFSVKEIGRGGGGGWGDKGIRGLGAAAI